jgi:membrane-associated protein
MLPIDLPTLIRAAGYLGIAAIIFAETGLLVGFFLPGDSLLFTAGFLASQGMLQIGPLAAICFTAAVAGDSAGYAIGYRVGRCLYDRPDSRLFRREYLRRAEAFFARHGGTAVVLARFIPVVRTFSPVVVGAGAMPYREFVGYNVLGGLLWAVGVALAGYCLGSAIPGVDRYLLPIIAVIVVLSVLPALWHWWRERGTASPLAREGGRDAGGE